MTRDTEALATAEEGDEDIGEAAASPKVIVYSNTSPATTSVDPSRSDDVDEMPFCIAALPPAKWLELEKCALQSGCSIRQVVVCFMEAGLAAFQRAVN